MASQPRSRKFGLAGTWVGLVALGIAVFHFFFGPIDPQYPVEKIDTRVINKWKIAIATHTPDQPLGPDRLLEYSVVVLGFAAIAFGTIGFIDREEPHPSGAALALGGGTITFQFFIAIIGAVLVIFLVALILSAFECGLTQTSKPTRATKR